MKTDNRKPIARGQRYHRKFQDTFTKINNVNQIKQIFGNKFPRILNPFIACNDKIVCYKEVPILNRRADLILTNLNNVLVVVEYKTHFFCQRTKFAQKIRARDVMQCTSTCKNLVLCIKRNENIIPISSKNIVVIGVLWVLDRNLSARIEKCFHSVVSK